MEQYLIVGLIVAVCTVYVLRKFVFKSKKARNSACGGCSKCGGSKDTG